MTCDVCDMYVLGFFLVSVRSVSSNSYIYISFQSGEFIFAYCVYIGEFH